MPIATAIADLTQAEVFPLIRSGGLFLIVAGISIVLGAFFFRVRYPIFGVGAAVAGGLTVVYAMPLAAPYGAPSLVQIASLGIAVALEMILLVRILRVRRSADDREMMLSILTIVGAHFVLMSPAFGPLMMVLAGASVLNVFLALVMRTYPSPLVWAVDGALKGGVGVLMFYGHQIPCTMCLSWSVP
ncbi:MAG: hypothetical protein KBA31_20160 [Alphaproteobacteria bacterium]|nr:hypothetical protein [Alphaproteobacteria bacterium]